MLTISPKLLKELASADGDVPRKLDAAVARQNPIEKIVITESSFRAMHAADEMATFKLQEGIEGFTKALIQLEGILGKRLQG